MWFDQAVVYQIYPLGLCGAPAENDGRQQPRILRVLDWVQHIKDCGANTVLFNPVFQSDKHGYDTRDYNTLDCRLGSNQEFAQVCRALHDAGIKVMLDGVFNHVAVAFGRSGMCAKRNGKALIKIGFISALMGTPAITMASGTKAGRAIRSL